METHNDEIDSGVKHIPTAQLVITSLAVGGISGALGISGGMFVMPVFLDMGVPSVMAAATSNTIVLLSALTTFMQ